MPHIIVKLYPGRPREVLARLAEKIATDVMEIAGCERKVVSVAIEEVPQAEWAERVYRPDILEKPETLALKPGYNPLD